MPETPDNNLPPTVPGYPYPRSHLYRDLIANARLNAKLEIAAAMKRAKTGYLSMPAVKKRARELAREALDRLVKERVDRIIEKDE